MKQLKVKSSTKYTIGTLIKQDSTGKAYKVVNCERIAVLDAPKYGLTLEYIKKGNL